MKREEITMEEIRAKQAAEADSRIRQNYADSEKQGMTADPLSSNLHREIQEKLEAKFSQTCFDLDRLNGIRHDLNDETVKRVLRVLSF